MEAAPDPNKLLGVEAVLAAYPEHPGVLALQHLATEAKFDRIRLVARVSSDDLTLDSITPVWPSANFYEREIFDLFGISFNNHPNLKRIMMPEDWVGHPLRKDYPVEGYR